MRGQVLGRSVAFLASGQRSIWVFPSCAPEQWPLSGCAPTQRRSAESYPSYWNLRSDPPRRAKSQVRGPGEASPARLRRLQGPECDDGCPRLPQAAPTYPASRRVAFLAPRDLYIEAPGLGRGVAGLGRTYARSVLPASPRPKRGGSELPRRRRDQYRPNLKRRGREGGHVIHQSFPEDRGRFSNSSCRAAAAGLSGDLR